MTNGYTKLFGSLVTSSVWSEDDKTRLVWITMLALSDRDGLVEAAIPGLARAANVSLEDCENAIVKLEGPDHYSRSLEHEGRRVERVDGGFRILNYARYSLKMSFEDRREYQRRKQAEYRKRKGETIRQQVNRSVAEDELTKQDAREMRRMRKGKVQDEYDIEAIGSSANGLAMVDVAGAN